MAPRAVGTGLLIPAAVVPTMTMPLLKSAGSLTALTAFDRCERSIQIRPNESVSMTLKLGIRIFSTPLLFNLTWKVLSPASSLSTSKLTLGYRLPELPTNNGRRRFTPSISGKVLAMPTPAAAFSNSGMLAMSPG